MSDPRFARLKTDPRFRRPKHKQNKVTVDERFKSVFDVGNEKGKGTKARVDKYGRAVSKNQERDNLRRFYRLEKEEEEENGPETKPVLDYARGAVLLESSDEEEDETAAKDDSDDEGVVTLGLDHARPIQVPRDEDEIDLDEDNFEDLDAQASAALAAENDAPSVDPTRRIAVVNLDWDYVKASHLFKIFSSLFTPSAAASNKRAKSAPVASTQGKVLSVRVYPSEFGKERIAREEREGPPAEVFQKKKGNIDEEVNETNIYDTGDEEEVDEDALRTYQLERLRYYYAIIEFDSVAGAMHAFNELEGTELERSANVFDLSYVPEDMKFDDEPRDEATKEDSGNYKPLEYVTEALRHSKVKLTWDEDDAERVQITRRALSKKEIEEADFKALIASSDSESDDELATAAPVSTSKNKNSKRDAERERVRALLLGNGAGEDQMPEGWSRNGGGLDGNQDSSGKDIDMEITFMPGLSERKDAGEDETTLEAYQRKMREKRKKRKAEASRGTEMSEVQPTTQKQEDAFFGSDADDSQMEDETRSQKKKEKSKKKGKRDQIQVAEPRKVSTTEELALLAASDNLNGEPKHFDMKAVLKAERRKGKKGGKKKGAEGEPDEIQEDFVIDVKDERFKAIHDDHAFAIDPSNPRFKKTKSMAALLDERTKQRKLQNQDRSGSSRSQRKDAPSNNVDDSERSLQKLLESVKRKSSALEQGNGKRQRI